MTVGVLYKGYKLEDAIDRTIDFGIVTNRLDFEWYEIVVGHFLSSEIMVAPYGDEIDRIVIYNPEITNLTAEIIALINVCHKNNISVFARWSNLKSQEIIMHGKHIMYQQLI